MEIDKCAYGEHHLEKRIFVKKYYYKLKTKYPVTKSSFLLPVVWLNRYTRAFNDRKVYCQTKMSAIVK